MPTRLPARLYLWDQRTFYLGPLHSPVQLSLAASRLLVGLQGDIRFRLMPQGPESSSRSLLLPVGWQGIVDAGRGLVADCHLDVTGYDHALLRQLARRHAHLACCDLQNEALLQKTFTRLYQGHDGPEEIRAQLDRLLNPPALVERTPFDFDPRILATIRRIKANTQENLSLACLAQQAGLSASRLVSLFKREVGIPIRRYRLWHRLFLSTQRLATGTSVTDAALAAGFADSAHFARTYRAILGFQPSLMLGQRTDLDVFVEPRR